MARKLILDLLFSERNHFCPFCEASGNCELQNLGYRYGVDHWLYSTFTKPSPSMPRTSICSWNITAASCAGGVSGPAAKS